MQGRPSRTNLIHFGVMAAVLIGALGVAAVSAGGRLGSPASPAGTSDDGKGAKGREVDVTLTGTMGTQTNADGETEYTLTTPDATLRLDAGPAWFFGDTYPLAPFVGRQVTIVGEQRQGSTKVDILTVDGTALREPGKPPWAGGWMRVGERHPGWTQQKADRSAAKQAEREAKRAERAARKAERRNREQGPAPSASPNTSPAP